MTAPRRSYRDCYLPAMTAAEIERLPDKARAPVIVATGAIEQHGPHLPVAVDSLMGQYFAEHLLPLLSDDVNCYLAPPITIGKSNEHVGFPGTLTISKTTLRRQLKLIARQIKAWGFGTMAILNTHGGNTDVILYTLREIQAEFGLRTEVLRAGVDFNLPPLEQQLGMHANIAETAWLQVIAPSLVRMDLAVREYPDESVVAGQLRPEAAPATFAWVTSDLSQSGIMGDAPRGTPEKGRVWLKATSRGYAEAIVRLEKAGRPNAPE